MSMADVIPDEIPYVFVWHEGRSLMTNTPFGQICLLPGLWEYVGPHQAAIGGTLANYFGAVRVRHG